MHFKSTSKVFLFALLSALVLQGCGSIQKCRYSRGWKWNLEFREGDKTDSEVKANKAKKGDYVMTRNDGEHPIDRTMSLSDSNKSIVLNEEEIPVNKKTKFDNFLAGGITGLILKHSTAIKKNITKDEPRNDYLGIIAFIFTLIGSSLLLFIWINALSLFEPLAIAGLIILKIARILLYVRIAVFMNNDNEDYKNSGIGTAAWVISIIAQIIIACFVLVGFFALLYP